MLSNQVLPLKNISDKFKRVDSAGILKLFDLHTVLSTYKFEQTQ